ncbi:MAG: type 1 glutamine amidotransferase [Alphaproteobacteria bacterium]
MSGDPRFLVVDGYKREARDELAAGGAAVAGDLYAAMLRRYAPDATVDCVYPSDADSKLPAGAALAGYDGIAWTGCSLTVYDDDPLVRRQIEFCRAAFEAGVPSFGSCWALQIAVVAAGGLCRANPRGREMGFARKIRLTPAGRAHPMYTGKADVFDAFISHVDEVTHLPGTAVLLASNPFTQVQAATVTHGKGTFWSVQYHPEYDLHEMARLIYCRRFKLRDLGFFVDEAQALAYVDQIETLHRDPSRYDIAWALGIDDDVMRPEIRQREVANWIEQQVIPAMRR